jgi:hypothetical protein
VSPTHHELETVALSTHKKKTTALANIRTTTMPVRRLRLQQFCCKTTPKGIVIPNLNFWTRRRMSSIFATGSNLSGLQPRLLPIYPLLQSANCLGIHDGKQGFG